jgi:hypothetical protein
MTGVFLGRRGGFNIFLFFFLFYYYDCEDREIPNIFSYFIFICFAFCARSWSRLWSSLALFAFWRKRREGNQCPSYVDQGKKLGLGQHSTFAFIIENYHNI